MGAGLVPNVPIGSLVEKVSSWSPAREAPDDELAYIDLSSVDNQLKAVTENQEILGCEAPSRARQRVLAGDILVSTVRPNLNGVARVPHHLDGATASTGFCVLRAKPSKLDPSYLFHWVMSDAFIDDMVRKATGASYPAVSDKIIFNSKIPLPPLEEQKRIAAILDQADDVRRKRQHAIDRLNQLGQAIFDEMFGEGGGYPSATLKSLGRVSTGSTPSTHREGSFDGPIPFITPGDLGSGKAVKRSLSEDAAKNSRTVGPNATLVCCIGTIGKMGKSYCYSAFNQQINAVEWGDKIDPDFGFYAVKKLRPILIHKGKGASTTLPILKKSEFEKFEIFTPPLDMQKKFAERLGLIQSGTGSFAGSFDMLNALFTSLQHRAFTGQL
jgi:type I restriction enzyme S subunit